MKRKNKDIKNMQPENVGAVHTPTHTPTHTDSLNKNKGAGERTALKVMDKKRIIKWTMLIFLILAIFCVSVIFINPKTRDGILGAIGGNLRNANTSNAVVSDATIISTKTGTGPFDSDDQPGNDSSENNNIVRSFDQVTWTVDLTMNSKYNKAIAGSKINVEATLPETCSDVMKWDLSSMAWIQNGQVSGDGRTVTGSYTVADTETSSSAKQTLVFVLQIYGAGNGTEIIPTFNFNIDGNDDGEKVTTTAEKVIVSAAGKYNVQLHSNTGFLSKKATVDYGEGETSGRMYGYGFTVQLSNDNESKGLKGLEYPKGEISFDINLKLERSKLGSTELEDITSECTPILWNYRINDWTNNNVGSINGRDMYGSDSAQLYDRYLPLGIYVNDDYSTYESGNIKIVQEENKLKVTINNYDFNGIFPHYSSSYSSAPSRGKIYTDSIGTFSVGYMQIFVPDNEASEVKDRNYYLTISDSNLKITSLTDKLTNVQIYNNDDSIREQHVLYKNGGYSQDLLVVNMYGQPLGSSYDSGNGRAVINSNIQLMAKFIMSMNNDNDIYTGDKFIKFDGEGFEPVYYGNGAKYRIQYMDGNPTFKIWYVTKKDGTNWTSQTEMNNANIEDMDIYDNIEDIPNGKICIGVYAETTGGYIESITGQNNILVIPLKVKENATIGKTYGTTQRTRMWIDKLDRSVYTITNKNVQWPTPTYDSGNLNYIKTEYDLNGNIVSGTHSGGTLYGNTVLVVGASLYGDIKAIDSSNAAKVNYDLGKNENTVTYSVEPQLDANSNLSTQISNVTLKNEVTIQKGLEYIPGSSKRGDDSYTEPEINKNSDGSTTLVWYAYNCTSGQEITPITFDARIDNEAANGTQYEAKYVVSEVVGSDGISKIGNSDISFRTSTVSINVINLESHRLYKEVETPIIEKNGDVTFKITYENKTETAVPDFQMLDILPYNGDSRGSNFNGTYTLKNINVIQTVGGSSQEIDNLKIYSTNSDNVKGMTAKDTGIGTDNIWESISNGDVNKSSKGIAIKGEVAGNTKIEVTVKLATNGNSAKDVYSNNVMAQVYSNSEQMQSSIVTARVVNRYIEGKVWQDSNTNGVIDNGEKYLSNVTLKLINTSNNSEVATTTTNENGEYEFRDLSRGKYKVKVEYDSTYYYLTEKEVGTNVEINSKFNTDTAETDEITRLDSLQSPILVEENVNAGLAIRKIDIPVNKVWEDNNDEAKKRPDGIIAVIKNGENEVGRQELNDGNSWRYTFSGLPKYTTDLQEINYTVEEQEKNTGDLSFYKNKEVSGNTTNGFTITNTYVEPKDEQSITKDGTAKIDSLDNEITYNISYKAEITDYEGTAIIKIVDTLPYAIDTTKTNILEDLDGGTYDEASKTITWEQRVENIQMTEAKEVTINKKIKVVYKDISQGTVSIKNVVSGHIEYETPEMTSDEVTANWTTTTQFTVNIPVSKIWEDNDNKLGQRPTKVVFKLTGSDGSERTLEVAKPGTEESTTTQDSTNPNKWNDMFVDLPKYDENKQEIEYTLTEEEKNTGDLKYYDSAIIGTTVKNTNIYGKVTVHHYIMNPDGTKTTNRVPDTNGTEIPDGVIEGKENEPYKTEPATNVNEKYELVKEETVGEEEGTIRKYDEKNPQEVIYYYRLKPAKVIIHYLEKDGDSDDSNNLVLSDNEQIDGHVDDPYNTDTEHKKDTITKDGKTYTLVSNSGNTQGTMTVADTNVTYYYLQNTKATVRYVEGNPETGEIVKDLETPRTEEGLVGDKFVTNSKEFTGYRLIQSPNPTTIKMTKEEQTLIYWYEPVYTGLIENHIDDKTGKVLYTKEHQVQVGQNYNIPPKNFEGYDRVTAKDPNNASGTMGEELVTVNYYYIKKAVLEVNYIDKTTGKPLTDQIIDNTKHEGDPYTTEQKTFEGYDLVEVPLNKDGTLSVETDENGNITNNKTVVTYYYIRKAVVEEHHIDIVTGEELAEPTIYNGHVGDEYTTSSKEFLSYELVTEDKDGNNVLPTNAQGTMREEKQVVTYYYYQPAKVIVHYVDRTTGKEIEETNPETGELQSSQVIIEGQNQDDYTTTPKDFEYYKLVESPEEPNGKMKVEITKDENGKDVVNNTIDVYYYYEPKPFNIGVEKDISAIIVNGNRRNATNGKLEKVDIYRKSTENTSVQVEYKIKVMNTGEVEGRAIIEDKLPEGMTLANNDGTWEENGGVLRKVIPEIGAGETKEYTVLLNWKTSGNNMGNKVNEVTLTETDNVPGFKDGNDKDNKDNATVSISVETGEFPVGLLIALLALVGLESVTLRYAVVLTKRQKKNNKK